MKKLYFFIIIFSILVWGCAKKQVVSSSDAQQPAVQQTEEKSRKAHAGATEQKGAKIESKDISSKAPDKATAGEAITDIHFDFDRYDIRENAKPILKSTADYLIKNTGQKILIEGHCDERGTNEYNLALGERRAKATKDYLLSLGISSSRMETISYGEEKPVCAEQTENCWARNRRAHFVIN